MPRKPRISNDSFWGDFANAFLLTRPYREPLTQPAPQNPPHTGKHTAPQAEHTQDAQATQQAPATDQTTTANPTAGQQVQEAELSALGILQSQADAYTNAEPAAQNQQESSSAVDDFVADQIISLAEQADQLVGIVKQEQEAAQERQEPYPAHPVSSVLFDKYNATTLGELKARLIADIKAVRDGSLDRPATSAAIVKFADTPPRAFVYGAPDNPSALGGVHFHPGNEPTKWPAWPLEKSRSAELGKFVKNTDDPGTVVLHGYAGKDILGRNITADAVLKIKPTTGGFSESIQRREGIIESIPQENPKPTTRRSRRNSTTGKDKK